MVKHIQVIRRQKFRVRRQKTNWLGVFGHFLRLALKRLSFFQGTAMCIKIIFDLDSLYVEIFHEI